MPRDLYGNCVLCPGGPPVPRSYLDAILVSGTLLDQGCPPVLLADLIVEHETSRFVRSRRRDVEFALARSFLLRRMAAGIA